MSKLTIYNDTDPRHPLGLLQEHGAIAERLQKIGVLFERWPTFDNAIDPSVDADTMQNRILDFYGASIERLKAQGGYLASDVIRLTRDHPEKEALRKKFLSEHKHSEDEVRFFVEGRGLFNLHIKNRVYGLLCQKGDLVSVPAKTKHWFDMGSEPEFTCIRLFTNPDGWVADYTQDDIATQFPYLD